MAMIGTLKQGGGIKQLASSVCVRLDEGELSLWEGPPDAADTSFPSPSGAIEFLTGGLLGGATTTAAADAPAAAAAAAARPALPPSVRTGVVGVEVARSKAWRAYLQASVVARCADGETRSFW